MLDPSNTISDASTANLLLREGPTPSPPVASLADWERVVESACNEARPIAAVHLHGLEHDCRRTRGLWIQRLHVKRAPRAPGIAPGHDAKRDDGGGGDDALFLATVEALLDSRRGARVLYEAPRAMNVKDLARWYLTFSYGAHACIDCGNMLVWREDEQYCSKCTFQHVKMTVVEVQRCCAFCHDPCQAELACSHPVHRRCFRDFTAASDQPPDHPKCPICRTSLTDSDLLEFVAANPQHPASPPPYHDDYVDPALLFTTP